MSDINSRLSFDADVSGLREIRREIEAINALIERAMSQTGGGRLGSFEVQGRTAGGQFTGRGAPSPFLAQGTLLARRDAQRAIREQARFQARRGGVVLGPGGEEESFARTTGRQQAQQLAQLARERVERERHLLANVDGELQARIQAQTFQQQRLQLEREQVAEAQLQRGTELQASTQTKEEVNRRRVAVRRLQEELGLQNQQVDSERNIAALTAQEEALRRQSQLNRQKQRLPQFGGRTFQDVQVEQEVQGNLQRDMRRARVARLQQEQRSVKAAADRRIQEERLKAAIESEVQERRITAGNAAVARRQVNEEILRRQSTVRQLAEQTGNQKVQVANERNILRLQAQEQVLRRQANQILTQESRIAAEQLGLGQGTRFQRLLASTQARTGRGDFSLPSEQPTLREFFGRRALSTAAFSISGLAFFGAFQFLRETIREAEELEKILNQIESQFRAVDDAAEFPRFRQSILDIARETGKASDEVAFVAFQMKGAFEETELAIEQTEAAIRIARVTGLELNEITDSLTAVTKAFGETEASIDDVGDKTLGLQDRFGVLARETIKFVGDAGSQFAQLGFTMEETATIAAAAQQQSGQSGTALAEGLNRAIPAMTEVNLELQEFLLNTGQFNEDFDEFANTLASGDVRGAFFFILENMDRLSQAQRNQVAQIIGQRRETKAVLPVLNQHAKILEELNSDQDDSNRTFERFTDLQETLSNTIDRATEAFNQFGEAILRLGLAQIIKDIAGAAQVLADALTLVTDAFATLNDASDGWILRLGEILLLLRGLQGGFRALSARGVAGTAAAGRAVAGGAVPPASNPAARRVSQLQPEAATGRFRDPTTGRFLSRSAALPNAASRSIAGITPQMAVFTAAMVGLQVAVEKFSDSADDLEQSTLASAEALAEAVDSALKTRTSLDRVTQELEETRSATAARLDAIRQQVERVGGLRNLSEEQIREFIEILDEVISEETTGRGLIPGLPGARETSEIGEAAKRAKEAFLEHLELTVNEQAIAIIDAGSLANEDVRAAFDAAFALEAGRSIEDVTSDLSAGELTDAAQRFIRNLERMATPGAELALAAAAQAQADLEQEARDKTEESRNAKEGAFNDVEAALDESEETLEEIRELISFGAATTGQLISALEEEISDLSNLTPVPGQEARDHRARIAKLQAELARTQADLLMGELDLLLDFSTIEPEQAISRLEDLASEVSDPDVLMDIFERQRDLYQQVLDEMVAGMEDAEARAQLLAEGLETSEAFQILGTTVFLQTSTAFQDHLAELQDIGIDFSNDMVQTVAELITKGMDVGEAIIIAIRNDVNALRRFQVMANRAMAEAAEEALAPGGGHPSGLSPEARAAVVPGEGDPTRGSGTSTVDEEDLPPAPGLEDRPTFERAAQDRKKAAQEAQRAQDDRRREARELAEAQLELRRALAERDPLAQAMLDQEAANIALRFAETEAERLQAQADAIRARHSIAEAMSDIANSELELLMAVAEAAGDSIEAAQLQLDIAQQQLQQARRAGAGDAELNRLEADVVRARANVRDTRLQERQSEIDFLLQMERITTAQAIAQFEALLEIPNLTADQIRQIHLKIKQLRDELSQDLQFNIPSVIGLPTLFEVRRLNQSQGGYQDNRQITVTVNAETNASPQDIAKAVTNAMGRGSRMGVRPGRIV